MLTLIDLLSTASAIGLVVTLTALGLAVLPWRRGEASDAADALDTAVRLPGHLLLAPLPVPQPEVARS